MFIVNPIITIGYLKVLLPILVLQCVCMWVEQDRLDGFPLYHTTSHQVVKYWLLTPNNDTITGDDDTTMMMMVVVTQHLI